MAATEIEDLAALVGIEILPSSSNEDSEQQQSLIDLPQDTLDSSHQLQPLRVGDDQDIHSKCPSVDPGATQNTDYASLEKEFAGRYTQDDAEFVSTLATPTHPPPCVTPWFGDRDHRGDRFRGRGGQNWGRGRGWGRGHGDRRDRDFHQRPYGHHDRSYHGFHPYEGRNQYDHYHDRRYDRDRSPVGRDRRY